jgi:hypothetical protein
LYDFTHIIWVLVMSFGENNVGHYFVNVTIIIRDAMFIQKNYAFLKNHGTFASDSSHIVTGGIFQSRAETRDLTGNASTYQTDS